MPLSWGFLSHGEGLEGVASEPSELYQFTHAVANRVRIPIMVKLSSNVANIIKLAKAAEKAGASAISGIDTVRSIAGVDIEKGQALLPTYGGLSGDAIRPIGLAAIASVSQATTIPTCGIGGISNYQHVLEYMMLGCTAVQICTSILINGYERIGEILRDLKDWMDGHGYQSFEEIRGKALSSLKSFEEIKLEPYVVGMKRACRKANARSVSEHVYTKPSIGERMELRSNPRTAQAVVYASAFVPIRSLNSVGRNNR